MYDVIVGHENIYIDNSSQNRGKAVILDVIMYDAIVGHENIYIDNSSQNRGRAVI